MTANSGIVWSRCDRPAQMFVELATTESFRDARVVRGPAALEDSDFTAKVELTDLPPGQTIFYRVSFQDLANPKQISEPATGSFRTAPRVASDVYFVWSGDTAGQGFGINRDWGGMKIFEAIRQLDPHFFLHSGDTIYADNPIPSEIKLDDGTAWKNVVTEMKSKVAETLDEFRGNFAYNLLDDNVRLFNASVPQIVQWDDHETRNNWYPGQMLDDARYRVKSCSLLAARSRRAFFEYMPIRSSLATPDRIYRSFSYGPLLDVFLLDKRSYRGPNSTNRQPSPSAATGFLGSEQLHWLKQACSPHKPRGK
jgi:alkaline phosphatase D